MTAPAFIVEEERVPRDEAIRALDYLGAQFVFCRNKVPYQKEWRSKYPPVEDVLKADLKGVGLVLASVGLVGVDVDATKPQPGDKANERVSRNVARNVEVIQTLGSPLGTVTTPSGGTHIFYKGTGQEGNAKWAFGDIRGTKGHVVLYDPAATLKAAQLVQRDASLAPVDVSLLRRIAGAKKKKKTPEPRQTPNGLQGIAEGEGRNNFLNDGVFLDARDGQLTPERKTEWRNAALASRLSLSDVDATIRSASEAGDKAEIFFSLSDTGNAQHFARMYADKLRYDHRKSVWFLFERHHWAADATGGADRLALAAIRERQRAAVGNEAASKWAARSLSRSARENLLRLARPENPLAMAGDEWDRDPCALPVRNGVVDLGTGTLRDGRADDFITKVAPVTFDAGADCPRWLQFLDEIFADNHELVA